MATIIDTNVLTSNSYKLEDVQKHPELVKALNTGKVVLLYVKETSNPEMVDAYFGQIRKLTGSRGSAVENLEMSSTMQSLTFGPSTPKVSLIKFRGNMKIAGLKANGIVKVGDTIDLIIQVRDEYTTTNPNAQHFARKIKGVLTTITSAGKPFYSNTYLLTKTEFNSAGGDKLFTVDKVNSTNSFEAVKSDFDLIESIM